MQKLFIATLFLCILLSLFVGHTLSNGYVPYLGFISAALAFIAMFLPFLGEYNVLHSGMKKIRKNFKNLMPEDHKDQQTGSMEIIMPSSHAIHAEVYDFNQKNKSSLLMLIILCLAIVIGAIDGINFYFIVDGYQQTTAPISNF